VSYWRNRLSDSIEYEEEDTITGIEGLTCIGRDGLMWLYRYETDVAVCYIVRSDTVAIDCVRK
jgi:hypothetical protein